MSGMKYGGSLSPFSYMEYSRSMTACKILKILQVE
jgi:hypothetical protein